MFIKDSYPARRWILGSQIVSLEDLYILYYYVLAIITSHTVGTAKNCIYNLKYSRDMFNVYFYLHFGLKIKLDVKTVIQL